MRKVLLLTMGMFALGFDAYVVAGLLPAIGATFNISDSETGQAVSVFTLCYALAAPIFATLLAGKPIRNILVLALAVFSVANGASALAPNFSLLLIARAVAGIGAGLFSPMASAAASALVSTQQRGRALGITLGGMSIGTVLGVPLGLITAEHLGWQGTLWSITSIGFIAMIGIITWFPNFPAQAPPSLHERFSMMTSRHVSTTVGITFVASIASLGLYTYMASILQNLEDTHNIAPYLWAWGMGGVVGSFAIGAIIDRMGRPALLMVGILGILSFSMFLLPFGLKIPIVEFIPFVLWGAMGWASQPPQQHILILSQPNHGPTAVALNSSANYLGGAIGAMSGGFLMFAGLSPSHFPLVAGCLVFIAFLGQLIIVLKNIKESKMSEC